LRKEDHEGDLGVDRVLLRGEKEWKRGRRDRELEVGKRKLLEILGMKKKGCRTGGDRMLGLL